MPPLRWQNTKGHIHTLFLRALTQLCIARWFQKAKIRTKYVILSLISRIFQANFERFTFKTCFNCCRLKYDLSISVIFRISFLAGFCYLAPLCAVAWTGWQKKLLRSQITLHFDGINNVVNSQKSHLAKRGRQDFFFEGTNEKVTSSTSSIHWDVLNH